MRIGMLILLSGYYFSDIPVLDQTTGNVLVDLFTVVKEAFKTQVGGLGLNIMAVAGFAAYMSHIGASQALVRISVKPVSYEENNPMALIHILDVTESVLREQKLRGHTREINSLMDDAAKREIQARTVLENTLDGIITFNTNACIEEYNPAAERIFGFTREEIIGQRINKLIPAVSPPAYDRNNASSVSRYMAPFLEATREFPAERKDRNTLILEISFSEMAVQEQSLFVSSMRDVTKRTQTERLVRHMAQHDALTNLPNRSLFKDRLKSAMAQAKRHGNLVAVMFLDLDRFHV